MDSVGIILKNIDNEFLLQHRDDKEGIAGRNMWSFFGGAIDRGETPDRAIVREIEEELCLDINGKMKFIKKLSIGNSSCYIYEYLGRVQEDDLKQREGQGLGFFKQDKIREMDIVPYVKKYFGFI